MTSFSDDYQADIIEAFNSTSRYFDDLINLDNPYFEGMVNQIYPSELQLNEYRCPLSIYIYLLLTGLSPPKFMINTVTLILIYMKLIFPFLSSLLWSVYFSTTHE